jgi:NAD(P)-dependent dehydrogenase (short-subunit alcohol dehydrogenase family)
MKDFRGKLAVVTGGGTGIGRELALQLVAAGADIAICDVFDDSLADAKAACEAMAASGARVSAHRCDVADEAQVLAFRDAVLREHATDHVELLFNNAGIAGGGSFVKDMRATWERTFNVCWFGVYYCTRAFLPLLIASSEACLINTSSINGVFAIDRNGPHTAYCSAKFAVKGFSEALITDLRVNAPHVSIVLVMPGHIGTSIVENTLRSLGIKQPRDMLGEEVKVLRQRLKMRGVSVDQLDDDQVRDIVQKNLDSFRDDAPLSAAQAAAQILDAVRTGKWRLLVGEDAKFLDREAREHPDELYDPAFLEQLRLRVPRKA